MSFCRRWDCERACYHRDRAKNGFRRRETIKKPPRNEAASINADRDPYDTVLNDFSLENQL
jgi:hypothetical protein